MDTNNLVVWLPFDADATSDYYGNVWVSYGAPKIRGGELYLDGNSSYIAKVSSIALGGRDFTICGKFNIYSRGALAGGVNTFCKIFHLQGAGQNENINLTKYWNDAKLYSDCQGTRSPDFNFTIGYDHHFEYVYKHEDETVKIFIDGDLKLTFAVAIARTTFSTVTLGDWGGGGTGYLRGTLNEFMIYDGVALHTDNFTPPTDDDYFDLKIAEFGSVVITESCDVERRVTNVPNINEDTPPQISFNGTSNNYAELPLDLLPGATTFTIEARFSTTSTTSSTNNWEWGTITGREIGGNWKDDFGLCVNDGKLCFWAEPSSNGSAAAKNTISDVVVNDGQIHTAAVRSNADGSIDLFCDGELVAHTDNVNAKITDANTILIGYNSNAKSPLQTGLYELRFWNTARTDIWTDIDGTEEGLQGWYLPTENGLTDYSPNIRNATIKGAVSYSEVNTVFVDVDYESTNDALGWRYEDCAVYFGTGAPINFHVPPTAEIWVRFDVYFDGASRWYAYDNGIYGMTGITSQLTLDLDFLSADSTVKTLSDICETKVTQTYLLHMISGVADGLIEVWCGLEKIGTYTGNVNNGRQFADFKLRSDDIGTSFTELIISNCELEPDEKPANTVRATKTSKLNTCNTKTEKIWLESGGSYPFPYLDLTTREVLRQIITETIEGEGEFSPITTIWLKFDVYFDGINRWAAYNISETNGKCGVFSELPLDFTYLVNDFEVVRGQSALLANQWQTVIVHMESAADSSGMIDVWIDGVQMHQYLGNVNNGEEFTNIYLTSEGGGTMFKNFIASSAPLTEDDTPQPVATGMGQLAFTVRHNGEVLTVPLKLSAVPINSALTVRWQGCDWYNPLVLPSAENASEVAVRYNSAIYALSYF